jgi:hypothetical protein
VQAAKDATSLIPIVGAGVGDLVELGLVTNLARKPDRLCLASKKSPRNRS